jgi:ABC-2 family transporter protein
MTLLDSPALAGAHRTGSTPARLVTAEIMKIRTTNTWWLFIGGVLVFTSLALTRNGARHDFELNPQLDGLSPSDKAQTLAQAAQAHTHASLDAIAGDMMTSGQFLGVLFALIIGILVVTNEFAHQTATATFMANPRRTRVIMAKFVAAACFGALFWLASTLLNVIVTSIYLRGEHRQRRAERLGGGQVSPAQPPRVRDVGDLRPWFGHPGPQSDRLSDHRHGRLPVRDRRHCGHRPADLHGVPPRLGTDRRRDRTRGGLPGHDHPWSHRYR